MSMPARMLAKALRKKIKQLRVKGGENEDSN
jgi:hypothetical protein